MKKLLVSLLGLLFIPSAAAQGQVIYENGGNYLGRYYDGGLEAGDQVQFADAGRIIRHFSLDYFGGFELESGQKGRVRLYLNDGTAAGESLRAPGSLLYDSGSFPVISGFHGIEISNLNLFIPGDSLTWTLQFEGLGPADTAGPLFHHGPGAGSSGDFFWQNDGSQWTAVALDGVTNNFGARFIALPALKGREVVLDQGRARVTAGATPGKLYALEYKDSLSAGWAPVNAPPRRATASLITLDDPEAAVPFRLYRVVESDLSVVRGPGGVSVVSYAEAGNRYALEGSPDGASWVRLQTATATGPTVVFNAAADAAFEKFRVIRI